uniref:non-specific serine/threonine protein kinase n=2 Tax=Tetranychus urticae TaxID=32264 RepID=T1KSW0_TETUR
MKIENKVILRVALRQFESGEKRQWPVYLKELTQLFESQQFSRIVHDKPGRIIDDVTRVLARILTTKLFPDIIEEIIVCLSTFAVSLGYHCKELFNWIFELYNSSVPDETRLVLLRSLVKIIESNCRALRENMPQLMNKVKKALEEAQTAEILLGITDIFLATSRIFPDVLEIHFRDIVDILIGWHLDSSQSPAISSNLAKAFISFNSFWVNDFEFSLDLLGQFLEDFEVFYKRLLENSTKISNNSDPVLDETKVEKSSQMDVVESSFTLNKMASLVRVYITVLKSLDEFASPERNTGITWEFIVGSLQTILIAVEHTLQITMFESLIVSTNECALFTLDIVCNYNIELIHELSQQLIPYIYSIHQYMVDVNDAYILTTLRLVTKFVQSMNGDLPIEFISDLLQPQSNCQNLRFMPSPAVLTALFELHHTLLGLKSVPHVRETYGSFLSDFFSAYSSLTGQEVIIPEYDDKDWNENKTSYEIDKAEIVIESTLISLTEIGNAKHSIIGMWALKPTFFDLLTNYIDPTNQTLMEKAPRVQYSILFILHSHCSLHNHFISNSNLITETSGISVLFGTSPSSAFTAPINPHTTGHFAKIQSILNTILSKSKVQSEIQLLCLTWFLEILKSSSYHLHRLIQTQQFTSLVTTVSLYLFAKNSKLCLSSCEAMKILLRTIENLPNTDLLKRIHQACLFNIGRIESNIVQSFLDLYAILPINCFSLSSGRMKIQFNRNDYLSPDDLRIAKMALMKSEPNPQFSAICFRIILTFLLENPTIDDERWLQRLCHSCSTNGIPKLTDVKANNHDQNGFGVNTQSIIDIFDHNQSSLIFWACWQSIQYCIVNKLRTPLGKAQDTFTKIEMAVKSKAIAVQNTLETKKSAHNDELLQTRMLILLMENLDKLMYNAYEGNASRLFTTPKLAKSFFRTNKATCVEWMNRNRRSLMIIALKSGDPASVWRHGQELLKDMVSKSQNQEIEFILTLMVQALMELKAGDAIAGLYIWTKESAGIRLPWIKWVVDEAQGKYETAIVDYQNYLTSLVNKELDASQKLVKDFIENRLLECYQNLGDWHEALECFKISRENVLERRKNSFFSGDLDLSYLASWDKLDDYNKYEYSFPHILSWDIQSVYHRAQSQLTSVINLKIDDKRKYRSNIKILDEVCRATSAIITAPILVSPSYVCQKSVTVNKIARNLLHRLKNNDRSINWNPWTNSVSEDLRKMDCSTLVHAIGWLEKCKNIDSLLSADSNNTINGLNFTAAKIARKQSNLQLSQNLLIKFAKLSNIIQDNHTLVNGVVDKSSACHLQIYITSALETNISPDHPATEKLKFLIEGSKLLHALGETKKAGNTLLSCIETNFVLVTDPALSYFQESLSKLLLTLVKYSQVDGSLLEQIDPVRYNKLSELVETINLGANCNSQIFDLNEITSGKLLQLGVQYCPQMPKCWFSLGAWSYRCGKRLIDSEDSDKLDLDSSNPNEGPFAFYKLAANSYFKFLHLCGTGTEDSYVTATLRILRLIVKHASELREILETGLSSTPTGPWKSIILQLFARLGHPEPYVRQSISELLCRIGEDSPHLIVFPAVAGSFTSNSEDIFFEGKITENQSSKNFEEDGNVLCDFDDDEAEEDEKKDTSVMQNCFAALVDTLGQQNPELISQTKTFIHELRRIIILWDELWIGTLMGHLGEMKKQVTVLEDEIARVYKNPSLSKEEEEKIIVTKHRVFLRRVLYILEQTQMITDETPETPHENWFQKNFSKAILNAIKLLNSPLDPAKPQQSLLIYQQLLHSLQKKASHWNSARSQLIMSSISPVLTNMEKTVIPMPGANFSSNGTVVTIEKVHKTVTILHTKTKPKKIGFFGSDGKTHTYLFKGHEDLHLDERIMHFLTIVNKMFAKYPNNKNEKSSCFRARHYSVTPLGTKSGLIQWVDGGSALYGFYKRWMLNRASTTPVNPKDENNKAVQPLNDNAYKPSEIFNRKLVLKGINNLARSEWSSSILVEILKELMDETPSNLIAKELWCASTNAFEYWHLTQTFTQSNAVMCMIGYIIGLGDRHLDNVLVDLSTGEVFHIDYNICFEKGKTLRVPERVPCRLTQNIVTAFGLTGVEGTFRISCEHVLRVLRKGRETLLTLLEAFLYDPLIDWTPGHEEGYTWSIYGGGRVNVLKEMFITKYQMEKENAEALLKIRIIETRFNWATAKDNLNNILSSISNDLKNSDITKFPSIETANENNLPLVNDLPNSKDLNNEKDVGGGLTLITFRDAVKSRNININDNDITPWSSVNEKLVPLKSVINNHNSLLAEIKHIIRVLSKLEEREMGPESKHNGPINQYYLVHRKFIENIYKLVKELEQLSSGSNMNQDSESESLIVNIKERLHLVMKLVDPVYDTLLDLVGKVEDFESSEFSLKKFSAKELFSTENNNTSPEKGSQYNGVSSFNGPNEKPIKHILGLERNTYATNVWKRVKMKLDGRDPHPVNRSSISEQVDYVIKESMKLENLALMYEGWTSWV